MPRASWKGFIKLSLVSVPVKGFTATASGGGTVSLNQLHDECKSRIRYQKTCPLHGEVSSDQIVMGHEFSKDQYAIVDPAEVDKLRSENDRSISIQSFVSPEKLDSIFFSGKTYYLTPDGPGGQKPYALLQQTLVNENLCGIAQVVISGKEQVVVLRTVGQLLAISILHYASQLKPASTFEDELFEQDVNDQELALAKTLVDATTVEQLDLTQYKDLYNERLTQLVQAKVAGEEVVAVSDQEHPAVINLMDALKASVAQATDGESSTAATGKKSASPKKKLAGSSRARKTPAKRKKKSG